MCKCVVLSDRLILFYCHVHFHNLYSQLKFFFIVALLDAWQFSTVMKASRRYVSHSVWQPSLFYEPRSLRKMHHFIDKFLQSPEWSLNRVAR